MHTNVKQIELTDTSVPLATSRAMYHKTLSVPLENLPDIGYLFRQLDERISKKPNANNPHNSPDHSH